MSTRRPVFIKIEDEGAMERVYLVPETRGKVVIFAPGEEFSDDAVDQIIGQILRLVPEGVECCIAPKGATLSYLRSKSTDSISAGGSKV